MVDFKIHWLNMMSVPESRAAVGRADEINGRDSGRYVTFQLAEVAISRRLFAEILRLIDGLRPKPAPT